MAILMDFSTLSCLFCLGFPWDLSHRTQYQYPWLVAGVLCKEDCSPSDDQTPDFQPSASLSQQGLLLIGTAVASCKWSRNRAAGLWWGEIYRRKCLFLFLCFYSLPTTASISNPVFKKKTPNKPWKSIFIFQAPSPLLFVSEFNAFERWMIDDLLKTKLKYK